MSRWLKISAFVEQRLKEGAKPADICTEAQKQFPNSVASRSYILRLIRKFQNN